MEYLLQQIIGGLFTSQALHALTLGLDFRLFCYRYDLTVLEVL
jgi:hypothetical protein